MVLALRNTLPNRLILFRIVPTSYRSLTITLESNERSARLRMSETTLLFGRNEGGPSYFPKLNPEVESRNKPQLA